ncbi:MAG: cytochrome c [Anaerolineae bacterium]|nr:cytochrome c [Anaerolineae bacterium]
MTASSSKSSRWPVYLVGGLFILVTLGFVIAFTYETEVEIVASQQTPLAVEADRYRDALDAILPSADVSRGAQWVEQFGCTVCHREGAANKIAPPFVGVAERAATRRSPLPADAYIYESITDPTAYTARDVSGESATDPAAAEGSDFRAAMPQDFATRLTPQQIGDIIAYLLTPDAR